MISRRLLLVILYYLAVFLIVFLIVGFLLLNKEQIITSNIDFDMPFALPVII
jgi:hypothetical protein